MSNIWKTAKLDFALIKSYKKTMIMLVAWPIFIAAIGRSFYTGISFAMCFIAISTIYPFSITEKNSMERLYGILPVRKSSLVIGRYVYVILLGLATLLFSLITHTALLRMLGETIDTADIVRASVMGILLFTLYTVFQLPGFYKFGTIKGRIFTYVPVLGFVVATFLLSNLPAEARKLLADIGQSPILMALLMAAIIVIMYTVSILVSVKIFKNKEL